MKLKRHFTSALCLGALVYLIVHKLLYLDILLPPLFVLCASIAMLYLMIFWKGEFVMLFWVFISLIAIGIACFIIYKNAVFNKKWLFDIGLVCEVVGWLVFLVSLLCYFIYWNDIYCYIFERRMSWNSTIRKPTEAG